MTPSNSNVSLRLELISAKARLLAEDQKNGRLWPGDLAKGLREIEQQLEQAQQESRSFDPSDR